MHPEPDAMKKLDSLKGEKFDAAYVDQMILDHSDDLHEVDTSLASVKDPDLHAELETLKPMVQRHLDAALKLQRPAASAQR
jgi:predicted outer membrane protein